MRWPDIQWDRLTDEPLGLLCRQPEDKCPPVGFHAGIADGLARFPGDERGQLVTPRGQARADGAQRRGTLVGGQYAHLLKAPFGRFHGRLVLRLGGQVRASGKLVGVRRVSDLQ